MKNRVWLPVLAALTWAACQHNPSAVPPATTTAEPAPATATEPTAAAPATGTAATTPAHSKGATNAVAPTPPPAVPAALVWAGNLDLVCEMKVKEGHCDTAHYQGKVYGFCSESCKKDFLEKPAEYLTQTSSNH